jgi:hypothetical protein
MSCSHAVFFADRLLDGCNIVQERRTTTIIPWDGFKEI